MSLPRIVPERDEGHVKVEVIVTAAALLRGSGEMIEAGLVHRSNLERVR